jgi:hypothetical protein
MGHSILQRDLPDDEDYHASRPRGGNFDTHHLRGSHASTSLAHSANLPGRRGSST